MAWIKDVDSQSKVIAFFVLSFFLIIMGQSFLGVSFLFLAWIEGARKQVRVWNGKEERVEVVYAGFWVRLGSLLSDLFLRAFLLVILYAVFGQSFINYLANGFHLLGYLLIEFLTLKKMGQTPGNMLMGIKVVKTDLSELTWKEIFLRNFMMLLSNVGTLITAVLILKGVLNTALVFNVPPDHSYRDAAERLAGLAGFWMASEIFVLLTNRQKRGLQDFMAGTVVVTLPNQQRPRIFGAWLFLVFSSVFFIFFVFRCGPSIFQVYADQGDPKAEYDLAGFYYRGWGVQKDLGQALQWYEKSAAQDDPDAQERLGEMYEKGLGVTADQTQALQWYTRAVQNGSFMAKAHLRKLNASLIEKNKNP